MKRKSILTGLTLILFAALSVAGCGSGQKQKKEYTLIMTDQTGAQAEVLRQRAEQAGMTITVETGERSAAVARLLEGSANCGYGLVRGDEPLQYGILKGKVKECRRLVLLCGHPVTSYEELNATDLGYLDTLEESFVSFLRQREGLSIHSYASAEQLFADYKEGILSFIAAEEADAYQLWERAGGALEISQPSQSPKLEYRFFAAEEEALKTAEAIFGEVGS